ncbi:MAG: Hpt domain-containing protein, partial [Oribacterium sp.]|nr:Hpt domain-containing protein [Oribacterium sp.]
KIYINTVEKYIESAEKNREDIERYRAAGDLKNLTVKIHALKSSSRLIGASKLGDFAARLEKAGEDGDEDTLERDLGELLDRYGKLVRELEPLNFYKKASEAGSDTEDDRPVISPEDLKKAYSDIRESCKSFDFDKVSDIVESLENHRLPENENERFEALRKALDDFDYDKIPEILAGGEDS